MFIIGTIEVKDLTEEELMAMKQQFNYISDLSDIKKAKLISKEWQTTE